MKRFTKVFTVVMIVALMLCGCVGPQVTITPEASVSSNPTTEIPTTDGPTSQPTDTKGPDCVTTGPTQEITTAPTEEITTPPTEEITNPPTQESNPTPTPTGTKEVVAGPTVTHQEVSKWDYFFTYGDASIKGTALTRFNDGNKGSGDGKFTFTNDGLLIQQANTVYADSYGIYSGANLKKADFSKAKYIGITVVNNEDHAILFGIQGNSNGKNIFHYPTGDKIALASEDGKLYIADGQENVNGRYCFRIPANFKGSVLIPTNRFADNHVSASANVWKSIQPIDNLGFHLADTGTKGILVKALFICDVTLKEPTDEAQNGNGSSIENENYSYTSTQRITPFWTDNTMYNESMTMMKRSDGSIYGKLLFVPTKINAIVNVYLNKEYKEGVDWEWEKGTNKIKWLKGSSIPYFTDNDLSGKDENGKYIAEYPTWDSQGRSRFGNALYCVGAFLYEKQICVSYTYDIKQVESQGIKYAEYQGDKLSNTVSKLKNNKDLKVLFYGDSIFSGCDASGMYGREPFMPYMHKLIEARLQKETKGKVTVDNIAVGGWTVQNGLDALSKSVGGIDYSKKYQGYDLLILSFGMNNANTGESEYKQNVRGIIDKIRAANPNLEVILVSCMNPNPRATGFCGNQKYHGTWNDGVAKESKYSSYTAVVDFYAVHNTILKYKDYSATTGNNINHPNDWLIRVYAQNILATMIK